MLAAAWLGLGYRAVALENRGKAALEKLQGGGAGAKEVDEALDSLRDAQRLNADRGPLITEGLVLAWGGRKRQAAAVAGEATAAEPENTVAWILAFLSAPSAERSDRARARAVELDPYAEKALP